MKTSYVSIIQTPPSPMSAKISKSQTPSPLLDAYVIFERPLIQNLFISFFMFILLRYWRLETDINKSAVSNFPSFSFSWLWQSFKRKICRGWTCLVHPTLTWKFTSYQTKRKSTKRKFTAKPSIRYSTKRLTSRSVWRIPPLLLLLFLLFFVDTSK